MGLIEQRRKILLNTPHIQTSTSNNFSTDIVAPLKGLEIKFEPIQSGSGIPAPDNIRPIDGRQQVSVRHFGKNLFDKTSVTPSSMTCYTSSGDPVTRSGIEYYLPAGTYTLKCHSETVYTYVYMNVLDTDGNFVSFASLSMGAAAGWKKVTVTIMDDQHLLIFKGTTTTLNLDMDLQIELGTEATTYEPFVQRGNTALGKNLFNYKTCNFISGIRNSSGVHQSDNNSGYTANPTPVNPSTTYTLSGSKLYSTGYVVRIYYLDENGDWISRTGGEQSGNVHFTTPSNCHFIQIQTKVSGADPSTWQLEYGSESTGYESYIPGYRITWGKNFYNPDTTEVGFIGQNGAKTVDSNFRYTAPIPVNVGKTYTFSATHMFSGTAVKRIHGYDINNTWVQQLANTSARGDYSLTFTIPNGISYIKVSAPLIDKNKQLEYGSTVTAYEPYIAGIVYGGTVDLVTGVLTINRKIKRISAIQYVLSSPKYIKSDAVDGYTNVSEIYPSKGPTGYTSEALVADRLKFQNKGIWATVGFPNCWTINGIQIHINVANDLLGITDYTQETTTTARTKLNAWLAENPVTLTIPIQPVVYQLTPVQIKALLNGNTFLTDDGKIVKVNYWKHMN